MKTCLSILIVASLFSCNSKKNGSVEKNFTTKDSIVMAENTAEKIARANGFDIWKNVSEIAFTFNVDRGKNHSERSWVWKPKTDEVSFIAAEDTLNYNRSKMDSLITKKDRAFINDKYWFLAPYQLMWDTGTTFTEKENVVAPISKDTLDQLTVVYDNDGGYTPGDAYDFFYDKNYKIREWNYRQGNSEAVSMSTTWEDYENFKGLDIATMHKDSTGSLKIYFTDISVKKEVEN